MLKLELRARATHACFEAFQQLSRCCKIARQGTPGEFVKTQHGMSAAPEIIASTGTTQLIFKLSLISQTLLDVLSAGVIFSASLLAMVMTA